MPPINRNWGEIIKDVILKAPERINAELTYPLRDEMPGLSVQELASDFFEKMRELSGFANEISIALGARSSELPELNTDLLPLLKGLCLQAQLAKARELDQQRSKTTNPQVIAALDEQLKVYDGLIREEWFQKAAPEYPPLLSDMLTLEYVEKSDASARLPERKYDESFHILQHQTIFLPDLHYYRAKCRVRGISVAVAFMDIDKFKDFNTELGEDHVDQHVLRVFMKTVEAHIYGHGYAYRHGRGDEFALVMPNAGDNLAIRFVNGLRKRVAELRFLGTDKTISLSVGVCVADPDCFLTDGELLQRAVHAKKFAKMEGRDRVAGYVGTLFDESELRILRPAAPDTV
jgi:diguanylate cyclase (GGDEF)-like protein